MKLTKPKLLHCAIDSPQYSSKAISEGFVNNGFEVIQFNWQMERFSNGLLPMRLKFLELAKQTKPELIFLHIQNPDIFDIETLKELQSIAPVINYTFDVRSKEGSQWLYDAAAHISLTCFACMEDVNHCKELGIHNTTLIQSSCDFDIYKKLPIIGGRRGVVFIGNNYVNTNLNFELAEERAEMVAMLKEKFPNDFKVYGMNWGSSFYTNPQHEVTIYNKASIAICQNNFDREGYASDRLFRAASCGAMVLVKHFKGIENMGFTNWKNLAIWNDLYDLEILVNNYLSDREEAKAIGEAGRLFVAENHSWTGRTKEILKKVGAIKMI
jgi:hypothetical protein